MISTILEDKFNYRRRPRVVQATERYTDGALIFVHVIALMDPLHITNEILDFSTVDTDLREQTRVDQYLILDW